MNDLLQRYWRTGVVALMTLFTLLLIALFPNAGRDSEVGLLMWLPEETFELEGYSVDISKQEADTLPSDTTYLKMRYQEKFKPPVLANYRSLSATLILAGNDRRSLHEPEICLNGQGWNIEKSEIDTVSTSGGDLEVKTLQLGRWHMKDGHYVLDKEGNKIRFRAIYVYWWISSDGSTPHADERVIRTALNNMFRNLNDRWGYPSIMVNVDDRYGVEEGIEEAKERAFEFVAEFAPKFQKSLGADPDIEERGVRAPQT